MCRAGCCKHLHEQSHCKAFPTHQTDYQPVSAAKDLLSHLSAGCGSRARRDPQPACRQSVQGPEPELAWLLLPCLGTTSHSDPTPPDDTQCSPSTHTHIHTMLQALPPRLVLVSPNIVRSTASPNTVSRETPTNLPYILEPPTPCQTTPATPCNPPPS